MNPTIDLNCDLGEGDAHDAELMALITSANICCGAHAGGVGQSRAALALAVRHGVRIGAHPGYADREHFGRRDLDLPADQVVAEVLSQVRSLVSLAESMGAAVRYLKPHGALYNQAGRDRGVAASVVGAARQLGLPIVGLPGSEVESTAGVFGVEFIGEGFADRRYRPDGSLVPRGQPDALVHSPDEACEQAKRLLGGGRVRTLCVHGDNPEAVEFVRALRRALLAAGFSLQPFAPP